MRKLLLAALLLSPFATTVNAQWSEDPAQNNRISPLNVGFYDPVMLTNAEGTTYFFFIVPSQQNGQDAFLYRMQIYSPEGNRVYGAAGKVIAGERNITWTKFNDYIVLDNDGNCIVSCFDLRDSDADAYDFNYYIYKVNPKGEIVWGPVALNDGVCDVNLTGLTMCATDDGGTAFAYTATGAQANQRVTHLERIDRDGHLLWSHPVTIEPGRTTTRPLLVNNGQDEVMLLYQDDTDQYVARVFDSAGSDVWDESVVVYSGGFSSDKIYPSLNAQHGPNGGVVFSVMDGGWDGRFIYMTREGEYAFSTANYGTRVAGVDNQSAVPSIYYDAEEKAFYAAFTNYAYYGYQGYGVNVQKFSLSGQRLWGDEGISIVPTQTGQQIANVTLRSGKGRVAVFYQYMGSTALNDPVDTDIAIVDNEGRVVLEPTNVSTSAYVKNDLQVSPLIGGNHYIVSWTEKRQGSTSACIYAQYVNIDGTTTNGIQMVGTTGTGAHEAVYSLSGVARRQPTKGLNIVRRDGRTTKFVAK